MTHLLLSLLVLLGSSTETEKSRSAWWLTASFAPKGKEIEGLPVRSLNDKWTAAMALQEEMLPPEARAVGESVSEHSGALNALIDLDGDDLPEKAIVGVYRGVSGEMGRFLLILRLQGNRWQKKAMFLQPGAAGFSVLFLQENRLVWSTCMECDSGCTVVATTGKWKLECESCCDD